MNPALETLLRALLDERRAVFYNGSLVLQTDVWEAVGWEPVAMLLDEDDVAALRSAPQEEKGEGQGFEKAATEPGTSTIGRKPISANNVTEEMVLAAAKAWWSVVWDGDEGVPWDKIYPPSQEKLLRDHRASLEAALRQAEKGSLPSVGLPGPVDRPSSWEQTHDYSTHGGSPSASCSCGGRDCGPAVPSQEEERDG